MNPRIRRILGLIDIVLDWQEHVVEETVVEVDGAYYVPDWVLGGSTIPIPAWRLEELWGYAKGRDDGDALRPRQ